MTEEEENKNEAYEGSQIFYEDDNVMLLKPNSFASAKYFGPPFFSKYYKRYSDGDNYIIVDKEGDYISPTLSYLIHKTNKGKLEYYDYDNNDLTLTDILEKFPVIEDKLYEVIGVSNTYGTLKRISGGEEIDRYELNNIDGLIGDFKFNKNNPGKSMVTIKFDDHDDYFKLFDLTEGDIWFLNTLFHSYHNDYMFYSSDTADSDWDEGYMIMDFDNDNLELFKKILVYIKPDIAKLETDDEKSEASKILLDTFGDSIESIINDYANERDNCMQRQAEADVRGELCDPFINYGLFAKSGCFYTYVTTVNVLLGMYNIAKERHTNLYGMLSKIAHTMSIGPYEEYMYEYGCNDLDTVSINNNAKFYLEKIIEEIEESDRFPNLAAFRETVASVLSKYDLNRSYKLTRGNPSESFRIQKIDPKTNKIHLTYYKSAGLLGGEQRTYSLEEFNNFLHIPELFENKVLNFKKKV